MKRVPGRVAILFCILVMCSIAVPISAVGVRQTEDVAARLEANATAISPTDAVGGASNNSSALARADSTTADPDENPDVNVTQEPDSADPSSLPESQLPVPSIAISPDLLGPAPVRVDFSAASSGDGDGTITEYDWDFGDGVRVLLLPSSGGRANHIYSSSGDFVVTLTISDDLGNSASANRTVHVPSGDSTAVAAVTTPVTVVRTSAAGMRTSVTGSRNSVTGNRTPVTAVSTAVTVEGERTPDIDPGMTPYNGLTQPPTVPEGRSTIRPRQTFANATIDERMAILGTAAIDPAGTTVPPDEANATGDPGTEGAAGLAADGSALLATIGVLLGACGFVGGIVYGVRAVARDPSMQIAGGETGIAPASAPSASAAPAATAQAPWEGYNPLVSDSYDLLARLRRYRGQGPTERTRRDRPPRQAARPLAHPEPPRPGDRLEARSHGRLPGAVGRSSGNRRLSPRPGNAGRAA